MGAAPEPYRREERPEAQAEVSSPQASVPSKKGPIVRGALLAVFIVAAVAAVRFTPILDYLTPAGLGRILSMAGLWGPVIFILVYAAGVCLFIPGTLLTTLGGAIFGAFQGFLYVWVGAMLGAGAAFWIGRTLGRDLAASLVGDRLKKYDEAIERNGFATVLYLRLVYFPFTPMNFGMGLTRVRFRDYFLGTALGIVVGVFIFTFFVGAVRDVWASGDWSGLLAPKVIFSVALFVFSFFIPKIIKRIKGD
jgi:uncharacterized membrane protein YdjX (TVP38/TMEM64 family)